MRSAETASLIGTPTQNKDFFGYNDVHIKIVCNLPGKNAGHFGIQSVKNSRPGCSLRQVASLWNEVPSGAALGQKTGLRLCKPQQGIFLPIIFNKLIQILLIQEKGGMVIAPKDYFKAKAADSLTQLRSGGYGHQDRATEFLEETTDSGPELFFSK